MLEMKMKLKSTTKTCYRFERRDEDGNLITLYLKKKDVDAAGIDAGAGVLVTVKEDENHV